MMSWKDDIHPDYVCEGNSWELQKNTRVLRLFALNLAEIILDPGHIAHEFPDEALQEAWNESLKNNET